MAHYATYFGTSIANVGSWLRTNHADNLVTDIEITVDSTGSVLTLVQY